MFCLTQMSLLSTLFIDNNDLFENGNTGGMSRDLINKIPATRFSYVTNPMRIPTGAAAQCAFRTLDHGNLWEPCLSASTFSTWDTSTAGYKGMPILQLNYEMFVGGQPPMVEPWQTRRGWGCQLPGSYRSSIRRRDVLDTARQPGRGQRAQHTEAQPGEMSLTGRCHTRGRAGRRDRPRAAALAVVMFL